MTGMCSCSMRSLSIRTRSCILIRFSRKRRYAVPPSSSFSSSHRILSIAFSLTPLILPNPTSTRSGRRTNPHAQRHRRRPQTPPRRSHRASHESQKADDARPDRERDRARGAEAFRAERGDDQGADRESDRGGVYEEGRGGYGAVYLCCLRCGCGVSVSVV